MHAVPDPALQREGDARHAEEIQHHAEADAFALHHFGMCRPGQEGDDIMRVLRHR